MAKYGPPSVLFLVDGYNILANKVQTLKSKVVALITKSDGLGDTWEEHSPVGVSMAELAQEGAFFDTAALAGHAAFSGSVPSSPQASVRIACCAFSGNTIGEMFVGFEGDFTEEYEVIAARAELQKANTTHRITGQRDQGQIIQDMTTETIDWDTESTPADYTLASSQRAVPITSSSVDNPTVITTDAPHRLTNGQKCLIAGHSGSTPDINDEYVATVLTTTTFTVPENVSVGGTGGTVIPTNSVAGGVGYQHVTAFTGFSGFIGKLRDSPDDITYGDLITFTNVTGQPAAERATVAGTIDRYVAFNGDVTGSGSITVFCGLARN